MTPYPPLHTPHTTTTTTPTNHPLLLGPPAKRRYGKFQAETAYYSAPDPFQRSPCVLPWDRELKQHVRDDPRNYDVGLSDEAGAGANVGFASKVLYRPEQAEVSKLDAYIQQTLWGAGVDGAGIPVSLQDQQKYGIRSSMFWSPQKNLNESFMPGYPYTPSDTQGWIWDRARAASIGRSYNYPHQTVVYYSMWNALHNNGRLTAHHNASWHAEKKASKIQKPGAADFLGFVGSTARRYRGPAWGCIARAAYHTELTWPPLT